jgi:hypothetical protein
MTEQAPAPTAATPEEPTPPLLGCLVCHTEGSTFQSEGRKLFGRTAPNIAALGAFGLGGPALNCRHCGSVAQLEVQAESWRIRYRKIPQAAEYYYASAFFLDAGWIVDEAALDISRRAYIQRKRVQQAQQGDLAWLNPAPLLPPPPLMSADEVIYLRFEGATVQQGRPQRHDDGAMQDSGTFYLTDRKVHLIGSRRDWSHRIGDVADVVYSDKAWRIYIGESGQFYQGKNNPEQMDAQLFATITRAVLEQHR